MKSKEEKYAALLPAFQSLMNGEENEIARMANLAALIHNEFEFWWTGFYRVLSKNSGSIEDAELVLGPFQGPIACTRIRRGKGVCGTAWAEERTVIVPDVEQFPGHIACSSESKSEIVVPIRKQGQIVAVLDIDSRELNTFDATDAKWLEKIADCVFGLTPDVLYSESDRQSALRDIWFAAGCFWGAQKFFKMIEGVEFTEVGFANGQTENPSYKEVYTDTTGHAECVHVRYNPAIVPLKELVQLYFKIIDPLSLNKQGEDEGTRYRTGVYYKDATDYPTLRNEFTQIENALGCPIVVELERLNCFYTAEEYHQNYLDKTPGGYCHLSPELFKLASSHK